MQILGLTNLTYDSITKNDVKTRQTWVKAIYTYQKKNSSQGNPLTSDGIIDKGGETAKKIEAELKQLMLSN